MACGHSDIVALHSLMCPRNEAHLPRSLTYGTPLLEL